LSTGVAIQLELKLDDYRETFDTHYSQEDAKDYQFELVQE
jgi:hypothetical protein